MNIYTQLTYQSLSYLMLGKKDGFLLLLLPLSVLLKRKNDQSPVARLYDELIRICESKRGHKWDPETKTWFLPKDFYHEFKGKISYKHFEI